MNGPKSQTKRTRREQIENVAFPVRSTSDDLDIIAKRLESSAHKMYNDYGRIITDSDADLYNTIMDAASKLRELHLRIIANHPDARRGK